MKECINYKQLDPQTVQCRTCSHFCRIQNGKIGICGVRSNNGGRLELITYGKAVAANVDPIEKKPLFHFHPGSSAYSFGTLGCNLQCGNCQNFDISQIFGAKSKPEQYSDINWGMELSPEQIVKDALKAECQSIAYTYNEPTVFLEYCLDTMKLAKEKGLMNVWVSNGFMSKETIDAVSKNLDAINIDIKSFDDDFYKTNCGARLGPVLENCQQIVENKIWLEVTTLVIPALSDSELMLRNLAKFIRSQLGKGVPWHISAFSPEISWKMRHLQPTPIEKIKRAFQIGKEEGLEFVYAGNVPHSEMENTFCPKCSELVVERSGFVTSNHLQNGKCPKCGNLFTGMF